MKTSKRRFYIYAVFRRSGEPCYIGKGTGDRYLSHSAGSHNTRLSHLFRQDSDLPVVILRDDLTEDEAWELEALFIGTIGRADIGTGPLVNHSDGGKGGTSGYQHTQETLLRMGASSSTRMTALWQSISVAERVERGGNVSLGNKNGAWSSEDHRAKARERAKARFADPVWRSQWEAKHKEGLTKPRSTRLRYINDGRTNSRLKPGEILPTGWSFGRVRR